MYSPIPRLTWCLFRHFQSVKNAKGTLEVSREKSLYDIDILQTICIHYIVYYFRRRDTKPYKAGSFEQNSIDLSASKYKFYL